MREKLKFFWETIRDTTKEWSASPSMRYSASLAYSAIFAIPGLLIIVIWIAGHFFGEKAIQGEISTQIAGFMGTDVAKSIEEMITNSLIDRDSILMKTIGIISLVFGATALFFQLQRSLNELWEVESAPKKAILKFLLDRANSFGMILVLGFLLMITMVLTSVLSYFSVLLARTFGMDMLYFSEIANFALGFLVVMTLFALMFKVLPDAEIQWKSVWTGAFLTTVLFTLGKYLLSLYFREVKPSSVYGTSGTVILIMMWVNYSCALIFFGAIYTKVYTRKKGLKIKPSSHAKWSAAKLYKDSLNKESS